MLNETQDTIVWIHFDHMQRKLNIKEKTRKEQNAGIDCVMMMGIIFSTFQVFTI